MTFLTNEVTSLFWEVVKLQVQALRLGRTRTASGFGLRPKSPKGGTLVTDSVTMGLFLEQWFFKLYAEEALGAGKVLFLDRSTGF